MKNIKKINIGIVSILVIAGLISIAFSSNNNDPAELKGDGRLQYKWYPTQLPKKANFAGEKVPLDDWEIRERFDRELMVNYYMHGSFLYILKLKDRHFPTIEKRLKANNIPDDFKYLCVAESALRNQTSSAGAVGYWQFLKATGIQYGLEISDEVDERYHLEKSTDAACKYLKSAYQKFGTWTAAAASYNCGVGGFSNFSNYQMSSDFYDLLLPEETGRYIFRILALKQLMQNADAYGYIVPSSEAYKPVKVKSIEVSNTIENLAEFAKQNGTNYKMVKILNPWLRGKKLTVKSGKKYYIDIPV